MLVNDAMHRCRAKPEALSEDSVHNHCVFSILLPPYHCIDEIARTA
jgi:hypothetical protein